MTYLFRAIIYSTLEIYFFTSNLVIFWRKKKSWFEVQLSFQILIATYLDFYTCTNISGFILRAIVRTISINVSWVLMFIQYFVNAQVPSNCSKHFQREICKKKTLIPKYLWFFCNRLKKLQNPTRQTKNRYIEGGEDWDEFITWGRDCTRIFFEISIGMRFTFKKTVGGVANPTPSCKSISFWSLNYLNRWNEIQIYNKMHVNWSTLFEILVLRLIPSPLSQPKTFY